MQLKALAAVVSIAFTLGVQAAPNAFDRAAGVKDLKRSYSHGMDMSRISKRAMALVAKRQGATPNHRVRKRCTMPKTTPSTPTPEQPQTTPSTPTSQQPQNTPTEPASSPAPEPTNNDTGSGSNNNNNNNNNGSGNSSNNNNSTSTVLDEVSQQWLDQHNTARAAHGAAPLTWDSTLANAASKWGNGCVFQHSGGTLGQFGENLAAQTGSLSPADAVQMWMNEASQYDPQNPQFSHFTQVVWKSTTTLGCAISKCAAGTIFPSNDGVSFYGVCEYSPPGNVIGDFANNVQK